MKLNTDQIEYYREHGLLFIPELFSTKEVEAMHTAVEDLIVKDTPGRILEKDKKNSACPSWMPHQYRNFRFLGSAPQSPNICLRNSQ